MKIEKNNYRGCNWRVVIGFVGGYYLDHSRAFGILVWTLVCAVIASGMVYCLRAIR